MAKNDKIYAFLAGNEALQAQIKAALAGCAPDYLENFTNDITELRGLFPELAFLPDGPLVGAVQDWATDIFCSSWSVPSPKNDEFGLYLLGRTDATVCRSGLGVLVLEAGEKLYARYAGRK